MILISQLSKNYIKTCRVTKCYRFQTSNLRGCSTKIDLGYQPKNVEGRQLPNISCFYDHQCHDNEIKNKFSMILPPPNVTGFLHLGHCLTATIQDVIARAKRKENFDVEWIPGTDHAGIATQIVVEKTLKKEKNLSRHDLGREKFLEEVWKWKRQKGDRIKEDLVRLGTSLNWNKEYFTMNENHNFAVREAFIRLFNKGLIYRDNSLVNWSCTLESAISDIEVDNLEITNPTDICVPGYKKKIKFGQIYEISYKTTTGQEIIISTTRPETLLGDVAVAVNPNDNRYTHLTQDKNLRLLHPFRNDTIPLIVDELVDPQFGTGALKITPGHDRNDFLIGQKHNLPIISILDSKGSIVDNFGQYSKLPRFIVREMILESLAEKGLLKNIKPHKMVLPICSRSKDVIELQLRPQWFIQTKEMSKSALDAVKKGMIKIYPENFTREWEHWLSNCHDWCISRQLWWGHRIPAWECEDKTWIVAHSEREAFEKANDLQVSITKQDDDVLDTWFSSAILPFALNGWPTKLLSDYYPLSLMETGHDIFFFWVARMAMVGLALTEKVPFKNILLHGIVCDAHGRKMSKSLGNIITPNQIINGISLKDLELEVKTSLDSGILSQEEYEKSVKGQKKMFPKGIPECGTDALRFTLCSHNIQSHFINFDIQEVLTNKLFFNKIWQATRYTIGFCEKLNLDLKYNDVSAETWENLSNMDKWILSRLSETKTVVKDGIESYNFHLATAALKNFFYINFCDTYLETTKLNQLPGNERQGKINCEVLKYCLSCGLDLMEPFTPFLSQDLKTFLPICEKQKNLSHLKNNIIEHEVGQILDVCAAVRQQKSQLNVTKRHKPALFIHATSSSAEDLLKSYQDIINTLTFSTHVVFVKDSTEFSNDSNFIIKSTGGPLCSFGVVVTDSSFIKKDIDKTIEINKKKLGKLEKELEKIMKLVKNKGYTTSASKETQAKHSERIKKLQMEIKTISDLEETSESVNLHQKN